MIEKNKKKAAAAPLKKSDKDTGSSGVQIAIMTARIAEISEHIKANPKDNAGKRGLQRLVNLRKKLLAYLKRTDSATYEDVIKKLNLRK